MDIRPWRRGDGRSVSARSDVDATLVCRGSQAIARWKNQGGPTPAYLREHEVEATSVAHTDGKFGTRAVIFCYLLCREWLLGADEGSQ
jgi:hypothetical protein